MRLAKILRPLIDILLELYRNWENNILTSYSKNHIHSDPMLIIWIYQDKSEQQKFHHPLAPQLILHCHSRVTQLLLSPKATQTKS